MTNKKSVQEEALSAAHKEFAHYHGTMKTKDFPAVKEAKKIVEGQRDFYNSMMKDDMTKETPKEVPKKQLFLVDTISTFRHKYVIEAESLEHAYDEIVMKDSGSTSDAFDEVTQRYLGETIVDGREISRKDFKKLLIDLAKDKDEMSSHWMGDDLIRRIDYDTPRK